VNDHISSHYDHLATTYDAIWNHRPEYVDWMSERMDTLLALQPGDRIADLGSGTGLFLRRLLPHVTEQNPVLAVDPSKAMLGVLPEDPRIYAVHASAEQFASGEVVTPYHFLDVITVKEAIHHFTELDTTLTSLAGRLAEGGRILIVTLPPRTGYPLFVAADDRFAAGQPEPGDLVAILRAAGLDAHVCYSEFEVTISRDEWLALVGNRWMSVLSSFSDAELDRGLAEIAELYPEPQLRFTDRFAFVLAENKGAVR